jgi:prephenate dehydratase
MKQIGFLGPKGTYSQLAYEKYASSGPSEVSSKAFPKIESLFEALMGSSIQEIIVPVENSIEGSVSTTMDLLVQSSGIFITNEVIIPIEHSLMTKGPCGLSEITDVISHPQPLGQCRNFLFNQLPNAKIHSAASTATAAEIVDRGEMVFGDQVSHTLAVIGHRNLGDIYGLSLIKKGINDFEENQTRFFVLSKASTEKSGNDKTSVIFSTMKDEPGGLYSVLGAFASRFINLTQISSRPTKNMLGEYVFFLDFEGHYKEKAVLEALSEVESKSSYFKLLGSYENES